MNDIVIRPEAQAPQTAKQIKAQVQRIQEVMKGVMKIDTHYGVIPGTQRPTLYKPGAEMLLSTFRVSVQPEVEDLSTVDEIRYRVHCKGVAMGSQIVIGVGVGECSTSEEKYKWRAAVCQEEYDEADHDRRRNKFGWKWGQAQGEKITVRTLQVRQEPSDLANTVLKMAKKRAEVDLALTALAASDIFVQDMEDLPEGMAAAPAQGEANPKAQSQAPRARANTSGGSHATEKQVGLLRARMNTAGISESAFCEHFKLDCVEALPFADVNPAIEWIGGRAK